MSNASAPGRARTLYSSAHPHRSRSCHRGGRSLKPLVLQGETNGESLILKVFPESVSTRPELAGGGVEVRRE